MTILIIYIVRLRNLKKEKKNVFNALLIFAIKTNETINKRIKNDEFKNKKINTQKWHESKTKEYSI